MRIGAGYVRARTAATGLICEFAVRAMTPARQGVEMTKLLSFLGFLVALALGGIAFMGLPGGSDVMAGEDLTVRAALCAPGDVELDQGYGVTRHVQRVCEQR